MNFVNVKTRPCPSCNVGRMTSRAVKSMMVRWSCNFCTYRGSTYELPRDVAEALTRDTRKAKKLR